jgi:hypothetical protein
MRSRITAKAKPAPKPRKLNEAQLLLLEQLGDIADRRRGIIGIQPIRIQPEYQFHLTRKWRIDVALLDHDIAIEIDGGAWIQGRHGRGTGIEKDNEKYAALAIAGWRLIRCTPGQVKKGLVLEWVKQALAQEAA